MNLNKRERIIFFITVVLAILFIANNFIYRPLEKKITILNRDISLYQIKLAKALNLLSQKETINSLDKELAEIISLKKENVSVLLEEIERLASQTNISLLGIKPYKKQEEEGYQELPLEIKVEANINNLSKFIYALDNPKRLWLLKKIQINATAEISRLEADIIVSKISF